ncbi:MAG: amino acid racemase [Porticoccaceae bacterium]|nr:amino acid racemase [Porticoccaceae bacterium]
MKKIGILGGLAWPSTVEYYQTICRLSQQWHTGKSFTGPTPMPEFSIESLNVNYSVNNWGTTNHDQSWQQWDTYMNSGLKRLQTSGADFAIIASNTPHNRLRTISVGIDIPIIDIFSAIAELCKQNDIEEFLLLGTAPTINQPNYSGQLKAHGINSIVPNEQDKKIVFDLIRQLYTGNFKGADSTLMALVQRTFSRSYNLKPVVCLACTELPLAFPYLKDQAIFEHDGVTYINTAVAHAEAAFRYAVEDHSSEHRN